MEARAVLASDRSWRGRPARFVLCVRHPCAWLVACLRYFRRAREFDRTVAPQFLRDPSMSFEEFALSPCYGFPTPVHRWNIMNRLWLNTLPRDRTAVIRQEDQQLDQVPVLERVERTLGLARTTTDLEPFAERIDVNARPSGAMERDRERLHMTL